MTALRWEYLYLDGPSGYATAARRTMAALEGADVSIARVPFQGGGGWDHWFEPAIPWDNQVDAADVVVVHLMPEYFPRAAECRPGAFIVGHTAWETDRIPDEWLTPLETVDLLVVPCQMNADVIREAGVSTPVVVIPHPTAPRPGERRDLSEGIIGPDAFTFYVIGEWTLRKGMADTVRAYARAFGPGDGVRMLVKATGGDRTRAARARHAFDEGTTAFALAAALAEVSTAPPVSLISRTLDDDEVAALHDIGDCYVSLCRGEGWGIGAFDAATRAKPVVTTGWSGHLDYLGGSSLLVRYRLVDVDHGPALGLKGHRQRWAEPDLDHAVELLRAVAADPTRGAPRAQTLAEAIEERCNPRTVAARWLTAVGDALGAA